VTALHHPIRDLKINAYCGEREWIALLGNGNGFPFFRAKTRSAVIAKAEAFKAETIAKHEAGFIARQAAAEKARLKAARKPAHDATEAA
jgi:hypothetical protein